MWKLLLLAIIFPSLAVAPVFKYPDFEILSVTQENTFLLQKIPFHPETRVLGSWVDLDSHLNHNLERIIQCESGGNELAVGKAGEIGILQFKWNTFYEFAKRYELQNPNIYNTNQQIWLGNRMLNDGFGFHWTCY